MYVYIGYMANISFGLKKKRFWKQFKFKCQRYYFMFCSVLNLEQTNEHQNLSLSDLGIHFYLFHSKEVILLTNDKNLLKKAILSKIEAMSSEKCFDKF